MILAVALVGAQAEPATVAQPFTPHQLCSLKGEIWAEGHINGKPVAFCMTWDQFINGGYLEGV